MQQKTSGTSGDQARGLLPGVSLIGDKIMQALDRLSRNIDEQGHFARWPDPVVHIEPENALLWSTKPGQSLGVFELTLVNTGPEDIDTIRAEQFYFLAEKTEDLVLKTLSHAVSVEMPPLKTKDGASFRLDFRPYRSLARELMVNFHGPSLLGVKVLLRFRRSADRKEFSVTRGYAALNPTAPAIYGSDTDLDRGATSRPGGTLIVSDGANYFTDSLNAGEGPVAAEPRGKLRLSEVSLYFDLPGHWVPVTHDICQGADGRLIHRYY
jgi:hypothetical protein